MIGIEKDEDGLTDGGTLQFSDATGLDPVYEDPDHLALHQFFPPNASGSSFVISSSFVIINGVRHSASHQQWQILQLRASSLNLDSMRRSIDSVQPASAPLIQPKLSNIELAGDTIGFDLEGTPGRTTDIQISLDGSNWITDQSVWVSSEPVRITFPVDRKATSLFFRAYIQE